MNEQEYNNCNMNCENAIYVILIAIKLVQLVYYLTIIFTQTIAMVCFVQLPNKTLLNNNIA